MPVMKPEKVIGQTFGVWKIVGFAGMRNHKSYFNSECTKCGKVKSLRFDYLKSKGHVCIRNIHRKGKKAKKDDSNKILKHTILTGKKFGMLTVGRLECIRFTGKYKYFYYHCACDCGGTRIIAANNLYNLKNPSCGCLNFGLGVGPYPKHDLTDTPEHFTWRRMLEMCRNKKGSHYKYYGGRGVKVADEWVGIDGFMNFLRHVGHQPAYRCALRRIDRKGHYVPGNVRWVPWMAGRGKRKDVENPDNV